MLTTTEPPEGCSDLFLLREKGAPRPTVPRGEPVDEPDAGSAGGILCRACRFPVTADQYIVAVNDRHQHTFFNPAGIVFEIRCFARAAGIAVHGERTDEFSWFAGYRWQYGHCTSCMTHLGWYFSSVGHSFYGLIVSGLLDGFRG